MKFSEGDEITNGTCTALVVSVEPNFYQLKWLGGLDEGSELYSKNLMYGQAEIDRFYALVPE